MYCIVYVYAKYKPMVFEHKQCIYLSLFFSQGIYHQFFFVSCINIVQIFKTGIYKRYIINLCLYHV